MSTLPFPRSRLRFFSQLSLYGLLFKIRLSSSVAMSAALGYGFGATDINLWSLLSITLGGLLVTCSGNSFNQWLERNTDKNMHRTRHRPLVLGELSTAQALGVGSFCGVVGCLVLLLGCNAEVAGLSLLSWVMYVWLYTPLKRVGPIAVLVGAVAGAMPPLLGCVAAEGFLSHKALLCFGLQFIWQFPHFWAIGWHAEKDYARAGMYLLPARKPNKQSALTILFYTLFLLPLGMLPTYFDYCGPTASWIALGAGGLFCLAAMWLFLSRSQRAAKGLLIVSLIYLPVVQLTYVLDKVP